MRRILLHRGMWAMPRNLYHMTLGGIWLAALSIFLVFRISSLWSFQAAMIEKLLVFAKVPYRLFISPPIELSRGIPVYYRPSGKTFAIPIEYNALTQTQAAIAFLLLVILGFLAYRLQKIPLPIKVSILFVLVLVISTIAYTSFITPVPPHTVNKLSVDWQYSGAVVLFLISSIFLFSVFPLKGPLWIKFSWLFAALIYSIIWNIVRISVVLSTLYHLGSIPFLILHYLAGIYIDFIYIIAFYSLSLAHLARHEVSEVGW